MNYTIFLEEAELQTVSLHRVGNKSRDEGYKTTEKPITPDETTKEILQAYFLGAFKLEKLYKFDNEHDLCMNNLYSLCKSAFNQERTFHYVTKDIAKFLYEKSNHVNIKSGELYVCQLENIIFDDEVVNGIGIFKSEDKETFLKLKVDESNEYYIDFQEGSNTKNIDKGCIILNIDQPNGFKVLHLDQRSADAQFFKDDFLCITEVKDEHYHTDAFLSSFKQFADKFYKSESKLLKAHFMQCCKDYFEHYKHFDYKEFKEIVFDDSYLDVEASEQLDLTLEDQMDNETIEEEYKTEGFYISKKVAKLSSRKLKPVIKLDTQMEIKIQSSSCLLDGFIEEGFDQEKEMKYYKLYFRNEK